MPNNIRILYDNAAQRLDTLAASSTAGGLVAANMLTDIKSEVWRSTGTTATLTLTWAEPELCSVVAIPFCNLTSTATMRVRGYTLAADSSPSFDTTALPACAYAPLGMFDWGMQVLGVNAFSFAGGAYGVRWFTAAAVEKLVVDLADPDNTAGYIEAGCLLAGVHWSPTYNAEQGATLSSPDSTKLERTEAGDPVRTRGYRHRVLDVNLSYMTAIDRSRCYDILTGCGTALPVFVSLFPEHSDPQLEQSHQIYGSVAQMNGISIPGFAQYAAPITIEEI